MHCQSCEQKRKYVPLIYNTIASTARKHSRSEYNGTTTTTTVTHHQNTPTRVFQPRLFIVHVLIRVQKLSLLVIIR